MHSADPSLSARDGRANARSTGLCPPDGRHLMKHHPLRVLAWQKGSWPHNSGVLCKLSWQRPAQIKPECMQARSAFQQDPIGHWENWRQGWVGFLQQQRLNSSVCMHIYTPTLAFSMHRLKATDLSPSTTSRMLCAQVTEQRGRPRLGEDCANFTLPQAVALTGLFYMLPACSHGAHLC